MRISDWSSDVCSSDLQAAAEDPVELADAGDPPRRVAGLAVELDEAQASAAAGLQALRCRRLDHLLDQGVPGAAGLALAGPFRLRSEEHTSELQSLMRISYAVFCLKKKKIKTE